MFHFHLRISFLLAIIIVVYSTFAMPLNTESQKVLPSVEYDTEFEQKNIILPRLCKEKSSNSSKVDCKNQIYSISKAKSLFLYLLKNKTMRDSNSANEGNSLYNTDIDHGNEVDFENQKNKLEKLFSNNETTLKDSRILQSMRSYFIGNKKSRHYKRKHFKFKNQSMAASDEFDSFPVPKDNPSTQKSIGSKFTIDGNAKMSNVNSEETLQSPENPVSPHFPPWANLTSDTQETLLNMVQGPSHKYGFKALFALSTYYTIILVVGVLGNGLICLIIATNSYMRTAPNIFLLNIALADLITLVTSKNMMWFSNKGFLEKNKLHSIKTQHRIN